MAGAHKGPPTAHHTPSPLRESNDRCYNIHYAQFLARSSVPLIQKETESPTMLSEQPVFASRGMVACAHYLASQAGLQILTQGGNAIDAAIAANIVMTVVYPSTCSAGGDVFMLIWNEESRKLYALNGSG